MTKKTSSYELTLRPRSGGQTLSAWLYGELRQAILEGRLRAHTKLPSSRDFAAQYGLSRGTTVSVFERLESEGYLSSRVGSGTRVNALAFSDARQLRQERRPEYVRRVASNYKRPRAWSDIVPSQGVRPFQMRDGALEEFPAKLWGAMAARRARNFASLLRTEDDGRGYRPLREAIAHYLGVSRGVRCCAEQIIIVSGVQQALDLLARLLMQGEPVWIEDPGYFGAEIAFRSAGARIVPVPVDQNGLDVDAGIRLHSSARGAYVTPGHQFPLGSTMSLERRVSLLKWAAEAGAFIIEDDYDSEYRFEGRPIPTLQSLDRNANVILVGSFNKLLFSSLRIGYVVLPSSLVNYFLGFRYRTDFRNLNLDQAVLCDFIEAGHLGRHLRRMRDLYSSRLDALLDGSQRLLNGIIKVAGVKAGLYAAGFLQNGMTSRQAEKAALAGGVDAVGLDRYAMNCDDPRGILLGFAAFDEPAIEKGLQKLAASLARNMPRPD